MRMMRKVKVKRNWTVIGIFTVCLVLTLGMLFGGILAKARNASAADTVYYKYYTNVEVQPGDTLWELAGMYMGEHYESRDAYIEEVKELNRLTSSQIISGRSLILPYYSTEYK